MTRWARSLESLTCLCRGRFPDKFLTLAITAAPALVLLALISSCSDQGPADVRAPSPVVDLAVSGRSTCTIDLTWTAVGDDGVTGRAAVYDLRYSTSAIDDAHWASAARCEGEPSPAGAGGQETFRVAGLVDSTEYYFRMTVIDDEGNVSDLSNIASAETDSAGAPGVAWVSDGPGLDDLDWTNAVSGLSATWAAVSGATGYEYAIGSARGATDRVGWRPVSGAATAVTHTDIDLTEGATYYFSARALLEGGCSGHGASDGITVDKAPPDSRVRALPTEIRGLGIKVTWTGSDDLSGVTSYDIQLRDGEAGAWTDWLEATADTAAVLEAEDGHAYFFRSRARDIAGNEEEYPAAADAQTAFAYQLTQVAWVRDGLGSEDADFTGSTSGLSATWAAVDGADGYEYAIGLEPGERDVLDWTSAGTDTSITHSGLALAGRRTYFFQVRVWDNSGFSGATSSDGITVDTEPPASSVYPLPDTLRTGGSGGVGYIQFYWEGRDRLSGIDHYDVQHRVGSTGQWQDVLLGTTATSTSVLSYGGLHQFRCRAVDKAGNAEPYPYYADAWTYHTLGYDGEPQRPPSRYSLKVALHLAAHGASPCKNLPAIDSRADLMRSWPSPGTDLDVFLIVFAYDSLSSFAYGLDWPADWGSGSTIACADLSTGSINAPGDGLGLGWSSCKVSGQDPAFLPVARTWLTPSTDGSIWITCHPLFGEDGGLGGGDCRESGESAFCYADSIFCAAVGVEPYQGAQRRPSAATGVRALFK